MISPAQFIRMLKIFRVLLRHTVNRQVISKNARTKRIASYLNPLSFGYKKSRGAALRHSFEALGPIFVKFGQLLSVRGDVIPKDIIKELEKLQDQVAPFPEELAVSMLEQAFNQPIDKTFKTFNCTPLASASVAQVHAATLHTGEDVVVKIIRPNIARTIQHDIKLMYLAARLVQRYSSFGKLLRPVDLVAEFEHTIINELDLQREAANASLLKRNFTHSEMMYVPQVHWDYSKPNIMVMERIYGVRINDVETLKEKNVNLALLAEYGVKIFFTQVFRDSFFHADMHPGNLFIDTTQPDKPKYIGVDFGIMGALSDEDQRYIGENLLAFFHRDYKKVAQLHIESGWVPADTREDQFEAAIRTVCEPIFQKSLAEISFGKLLLKLLQVAKTFNMQVQPQLMLLQKTLIGIEGLGRKLYPQLDLWSTAKPFLEKWVKEQKHPKNLLKKFTENLQPNLASMINLPAKLDRFLSNQPTENTSPQKKHHTNKTFMAIGLTAAGLAALESIPHHYISIPLLLGISIGCFIAQAVRHK